jgi:uncharacterized membrane protein
MTLLFAFLIGLFAGLRSLTPPAAVAWAVHLGWLTLRGHCLSIGSLPAVIILSVLAITEIILISCRILRTALLLQDLSVAS